MIKYKWIIIIANLIILLGLFNYSLVQKETLLSEGKLILLELAPVDPRSLMQGDYMSLRYAISDVEPLEVATKRGFCVVMVDDNGIARKVRIQENRTPITNEEYLIKYTSKTYGDLNIGAESYFFQEGEAEKYEKAKYGGLKVDDQGNSLLMGLYDENLKRI